MNSHAWGENRILSFLKEARILKQAYHDDSIPFPPPRFLSIWLSQVCNLDCTYCYFSYSNHDKEKTFIETKLMLAWLKEMKQFGAESLEFSGGGEPTLHKDFNTFISETYDMGYKLGIITHACNLKLPVNLLSQRMKYVRVGLDSATAETHDLIKRNKQKKYWFYVVVENIQKLVALRETGFSIGIKIILNKINQHEIIDMINLARKLDVDYIQIKSEHSSDNSLDDNEKREIQDKVLRESVIESRTKIFCNLFHVKSSTSCFMSPIHTVVTATGNILQCCFFEHQPIGDIYQPLKDIWGGSLHRKIIRETLRTDCDKVDCRWHIYNTKMNSVLEDPLNEISFI